MVREIISSQIWIGNRSDRDNLKQLYNLEIKAIVDLAAEELPATLARDFIYCRIPLTDDGNNSSDEIKLAIETVVNLRKKGIPTLICCSAGMNRSPVIAASALAVEKNIHPKNSLDSFNTGSPMDISASLWEQAKQVVNGME